MKATKNIRKPKRLSFQRGNAKLKKTIATFSLPAGHTCPLAHLCLAFANRETGKITDGAQAEFRCFAASAEAAFPSVRQSRWENYELLKGLSEGAMIDLISKSIPNWCTHVRIHVSGDFFNETYFRAWIAVARLNPGIVFYAYTKMIPFIVKYGQNPCANFHLVASRGGSADQLIDKHNLKEARVVNYVEDAQALGLEIDHDDSHAYDPTKGSFALTIHGTQRKGTAAAAAWKVNKAAGLGYGKK